MYVHIIVVVKREREDEITVLVGGGWNEGGRKEGRKEGRGVMIDSYEA